MFRYAYQKNTGLFPTERNNGLLIIPQRDKDYENKDPLQPKNPWL